MTAEELIEERSTKVKTRDCPPGGPQYGPHIISAISAGQIKDIDLELSSRDTTK